MCDAWTPSDLGLDGDVPDRFADLTVSTDDLTVDVDEHGDQFAFDLRDPDALADERDAALDTARELVESESVRPEHARGTVIGAMRAEYLRRQYAGVSPELEGSA
jgi:hypothetical protein